MDRRQFRHHLRAQQLATLIEPLCSQILSLPHQHVESVESNGIGIRRKILQAAERRTAGLVDGNDLTINDRFVWQTCERFSEGMEAAVEPFSIAGKSVTCPCALLPMRDTRLVSARTAKLLLLVILLPRGMASVR